jgi:hypothetical protein
VNVGPQPYSFPNPFDHAQLGHFSLPILLVLTIGHDHTPQPTPIFSTHSQPPPKVFSPTCGCQFITRGLICHQHSCQTSNSSYPNLCDHPSSIPSLPTTPLASTWTCVSSLDVFGSFHLSLCIIISLTFYGMMYKWHFVFHWIN